MYLLTEWEGRTGKYLARGHGVRTERSEVRAPWPRAKYFPVWPDLTQSISILSYDHRTFPFIPTFLLSFFWPAFVLFRAHFQRANDITPFIWEASKMYLNSANFKVQNILMFFEQNNLQSKVLISTKSRSRSKFNNTIHKSQPSWYTANVDYKEMKKNC